MLFDEIMDAESRQILREGHWRQAAYLTDALNDAHARGLLRHEPPGETADIWLDLLTGAAVRGALADPAAAARLYDEFLNAQSSVRA